jgi:hypothetical protein
LSTLIRHIFSLVIEAFKFLKSRFDDAIEEIEIENVWSDVDESQNQFENSQIQVAPTVKKEVTEKEVTKETQTEYCLEKITASNKRTGPKFQYEHILTGHLSVLGLSSWAKEKFISNAIIVQKIAFANFLPQFNQNQLYIKITLQRGNENG